MNNTFFEKNKYLKWVFLGLFILTACLHFYFSLQDAAASSELSGSVTEVVVDTINEVAKTEITVEQAHGVIRKLIGHFAWFALIGIFGYLTFRSFLYKKYYLVLSIGLPVGFLIALASELLQKVKSGRSCEFKDMMIDFSGYALSFVIFIIVFIIIYFKNKKKTLQD